MSAYAYGMLAVISLSLAGVCAVLTAIFFFAKNIRGVHDDLTGRTAERAIAELRQGKGSRSRFFGGEDGGAKAGRSARSSRASKHDTSGSLRLRRFSADDISTTEMEGTESEAGTTMLGTARSEADTTMPGATESEAGTTMLSAVGANTGGEAATSLLGGAEAARNEDEAEGATSLLSSPARKELR